MHKFWLTSKLRESFCEWKILNEIIVFYVNKLNLKSKTKNTNPTVSEPYPL